MPRTTIKRSLFIGAGGTGMDTLLSTKKFYVDTYGKVPPMVAFLGLDTDAGYYDKKQRTRIGAEIGLTKGEIYQLTVDQPKQIFLTNKGLFDWMPDNNEQYLSSLRNGAGQVRSNGRFAISYRSDKLLSAVRTKLTNITNATIADNEEFCLAGDSKVYVHVIFSISGGTGCGTFLDLLYKIDEICRSSLSGVGYRIYAYAVLPEIFNTMAPGSPSMRNTQPNAYGALMDIDYLSNLRKRSFNFKYPDGSSILVDSFPVPWMTLISNRNEWGDTYTQISHITEMLSLSLVTLSGDYGAEVASPLDNVELQLPNFEVSGKKAWVCGMGMSEILFDGELMARLYSMKVGRALIAKMIGESHDTDINQEVLDWINLSDVDICEHEKDPVIDFVMSKTPKVTFSESYIDSIPNLRNDVTKYLETDAVPKQQEIKAKVDEKSSAVVNALHDRIVNMVNREYGIGDAKKFLDELGVQIDLYKTEMTNELAAFKDKVNFAEKNIDANCQSVAEANDLGVFNFKKKSRVREAQEALVESVNAYAIILREIKRREAALQIYNNINERIEAEKNIVNDLAELLRSVDLVYSKRENEIQNKSAGDQSFVISMHSEMLSKVRVNPLEYSVAAFAKTLEDESQVYSLAKMKEGEVAKLVATYSSSLPETNKWRGVNVDDILRGLSVEEYNTVIEKAIRRSAPLLTYDYHGEIPQLLNELFIIGTPDKTTTVLNEKPSEDLGFEDRRKTLHEVVSADKSITLVSTGAKDRVIIYRLVTAVPPFVISGIDSYKRLYDQTKNINFHVDANIEKAMKADGFSLFPGKGEDEALGLWVKGLLLKRINNVGGIYTLETKVKGLGGIKGQYKLNTKSNRRDDAYEKFKSIYGLVKDELSDYVQAAFDDMGTTKMMEFLKNVQQESPRDVYYDDYSQVNLKKETLINGGPTYEPILELIQKEKDFIENII